MKPFTERMLCQDGRIRAVRGLGAAHGGLAEAGWGRQHHELAVDVRMGRHVGHGPPGPHGPEEEIVVTARPKCARVGGSRWACSARVAIATSAITVVG